MKTPTLQGQSIVSLGGVTNTNLTTASALSQFAKQIEAQVYSDPTGARKLLLQFAELLAQSPDESSDAHRLVMLGNLANLEYRFEDALASFAEAKKIYKDIGDAASYADLLADEVGTLLNLDRVGEAAKLLDEGLETAQAKQLASSWRLFVREGFLNLKLAELEDAVASFAEAKKSLPSTYASIIEAKDAYYAALLFAGFGGVYLQGQELERAIEAYTKVVDICNAANMRGRLPYHYLDLGRAYMTANRRAEATSNFELAIASAGQQDKHALASASANLGYYAYADENWEEAIRRFDEAEHHYKTSGAPSGSDLSVISLWRARLERARDNHSAAEEALIDSFTRAKAGDDRSQLSAVCLEIADYYAAAGRYDLAYDYRVLYDEIYREVERAERAQRIGELTLRQEVEERRRESQLLKLKAARLQLKALRAQMNPHFIFNALNSIQQFITSNRGQEAATHLAHFARLMRQSLDYSEREVITLEEEVDFLNNYLELNRNLRFEGEFTFDISIGDDLEDDLIGLPAMLVQPYVENAVEHGVRLVEHGHVAIHFDSPTDNDELLVITITDNGIGRKSAAKRKAQQESAHRSMGTTITKNRLDLLNASTQVETSVTFEDLIDTDGSAAGTRVKIVLPISWQG